MEFNNPTSELRKEFYLRKYSGQGQTNEVFGASPRLVDGIVNQKKKKKRGNLYFIVDEYVFGRTDLERDKLSLPCPFCGFHYAKGGGFILHVVSCSSYTHGREEACTIEEAREIYNKLLPAGAPPDRKIVVLEPRTFHTRVIRNAGILADKPTYPHEVELIVEGRELLDKILECKYMREVLNLADTNKNSLHRYAEDFEKRLSKTMQDYIMKIESPDSKKRELFGTTIKLNTPTPIPITDVPKVCINCGEPIKEGGAEYCSKRPCRAKYQNMWLKKRMAEDPQYRKKIIKQRRKYTKEYQRRPEVIERKKITESNISPEEEEKASAEFVANYYGKTVDEMPKV